MTGLDLLNNPLVLGLVGFIISALVARAIIKGVKSRKASETPATLEEIKQLKLDLERAQLNDKIAKIKQNKPESGGMKLLKGFIKGSEAGRKARKEFKL